MASVLVVDDDETTRLMLGSAAQAVGHHVRYASNGRMAINAYRTSPGDIVVMDIAMPDLNGLCATRELLAEFPDARVIVISGENADQLDYGMEYGAVATIIKPVDPKHLQELLDTISRRKGVWEDTTVR